MLNKRGFFVFVFLILILSLYSVNALDVFVSSEKVLSTIINDHDEAAVFKVTVNNQELSNSFDVYTFEKFQIVPEEINISAGKTETFEFKFYPIGSMKDNIGYVTVPYYIRSKGKPDTGTQVGNVIIKLVEFENAFGVGGENINPDATSFKLYFYNVEDRNYDNVEVIFSSVFFDDNKQSISLRPYERKEIIVPINKDKLKNLLADSYTVKATVTLNGKTTNIDGFVKILEKSGLSVSEDSSGILIRKYTIEKLNEGNVPTVAEIDLRKNVISRLFSTFSLEPSKIERKGFFVYYNWQKELGPNQALNVRVTTNWIFPFLLLVAILIIVFLINNYMKQDLIMKKRISIVKSKSDHFALKVTVRIKARKFMEKVTLYDRLPGMAKIYEKFPIHPSKIDHERGKIQWDLGRLIEGEQREFSYIIYSKINVIGKFELPAATAFYEINGKPSQAKSNRVFFVNNPREHVEEKF